MPRLKPPRNADPLPEPPEEHVAPTEAIEIVLDGDEPSISEVDLAAPREPEPQAPPAAAAPEPPENPLQRALADSERAEQLQRENTRISQERDAAVRRASEADRDRDRERADREEAEYNSVLTAIAAEQAALDKAESDYAAAASASDWQAAGKAQRVIGTSSARLDRLEDGKRAFDTKRETPPQSPTAQAAPQPAPHDFEAKLSAIAGLPDTAKSWLRQHPEFVNDAHMNKKIGAAHNYLVDVQSVAPFSDAYFASLDQQFGFKAAAPAPAPVSDPQPQPQRRSMTVSAPVSREVPTQSGERPSSTKITLTAEERAIAHNSFSQEGMTNADKERLYAQGKKRMIERKSNGTYGQERQ